MTSRAVNDFFIKNSDERLPKNPRDEDLLDQKQCTSDETVEAKDG